MRRVGDMVVDAKARARFSELWRRWDGILSDNIAGTVSSIDRQPQYLLPPGTWDLEYPVPVRVYGIPSTATAGQGPIYLILATSRIRASPASMHIISSGRR